MLDATKTQRGGRRTNWVNISTVLSAAILISAEVFGAAFAGGWALHNLFLSSFFSMIGLENYGTHITQGALFLAGIAVMVAFIRAGMRIEPFTSRQ